MFIANNDSMVVLDTMIDHDLGMGPVCYDFSNFMTKYGLVIPCGARSSGILEMIRDAEDEEQFKDPSFVSKYTFVDYTTNVFYMDYRGRAYIMRWNGEDAYKIPMPLGKHWTVLGSIDVPEAAAINNVLYGRELSVASLREEVDSISSIRILKPETIIKKDFIANAPENAPFLPVFEPRKRKEKS